MKKNFPKAKWEICRGSRFACYLLFLVVSFLVYSFSNQAISIKKEEKSKREDQDETVAQGGRIMLSALHGYDMPLGTDIKLV